MKISHSAWKKYMTCPKLYDYHYNERLRPVGKSSALAFGVAIDEALNHLLLGGKEPVKTFKKHFEWADMGDMLWMDKDFNETLFTPDQLKRLDGKDWQYKSWASLRVKGRLLIEAYEQNIYPLIEEVHHVQKEIDGRPGFLDAVLTIKGVGKVLIDHKTSSNPYRRDSAAFDTQLNLYALSQNVDTCGFIVLRKDMPLIKNCSVCGSNGTGLRHKTCPVDRPDGRCGGTWVTAVNTAALTQLITAPVNPRIGGMIEGSINAVEKAIGANIYPQNLFACGKMYGKPCPYFDKCWHGKDHGLAVTEKVLSRKT